VGGARLTLSVLAYYSINNCKRFFFPNNTKKLYCAVGLYFLLLACPITVLLSPNLVFVVDLGRLGNNRTCLASVAVVALSTQSCTAFARVTNKIRPFRKMVKVEPVCFFPIDARWQ
jgi:hypothetical protein